MMRPSTYTPPFPYTTLFRSPGRISAHQMYGARGWMMHHNTDIFGRTGLHDEIRWGVFPLGGTWMTFPVWRHYALDRKSTRLNSSHVAISYAVFCWKKKKTDQ